MSRDPFARADPTDDARFYAYERKVVHLEAGAIEALRAYYARALPQARGGGAPANESSRGGGAPAHEQPDVLDLMSSWRSHLPSRVTAVGLGMNAAEMADNPQLSSFVVHDLNRDPRLPFADESFDAAVCAVSVQYLTRPLEVWADVRRVLRPGGVAIVSFSNRCFPTKAVAVWMANDDAGHRALVRTYLERSGFADVADGELDTPDDPLFVVRGTKEAARPAAEGLATP